ncbi:MAG: hypothetical protein WCV72_00715 [Patescibacteria group bacterium]
MSTRIKALMLSLTIGLTSLLGVATLTTVTAPSATADNIRNSCTTWQINQGVCEPDMGLRKLVQIIINWFLYFLGFIATIFLIYGGFLYVTAGVSDDNIAKAKKIITYAVIGIILILIAAVLVNALLNMIAGGIDNPVGG